MAKSITIKTYQKLAVTIIVSQLLMWFNVSTSVYAEPGREEVDPVVQYIADVDHVTVDEAAARASLESKSEVIAKIAAEVWPDSYGGLHYLPGLAYIRLKGEVDPRATGDFAEALKSVGVPADRVRTESVDYKESELQAYSEDVAALISNVAPKLRYFIQPTLATETISVSVYPDQVSLVETILTQLPDVPDRLVTINGSKDLPNSQSCNTINRCTSPLRGGAEVLFSSRSSDFVCTTGFTVTSKSDGKPYVMTAGHCGYDVGDPFYSIYPDGTQHSIGPKHSSTFGSGGDAGLVSITNTNFSTEPWVVSATNYVYEIHSVGSSAIGMRICKTGRTTHTNCGTVTNLGVSATYCDASDSYGNCLVRPTFVNNMGKTDICSAGGDSGGPYFSYNVAYGIHSGGPDSTSGGCFTLYTSAAGDAAALNVSIATA